MLDNGTLMVGLDAGTGLVRRLVHRATEFDYFQQLRSTVREQFGGLRIFDELLGRRLSDFADRPKVTVDRAEADRIVLSKRYRRWPVRVTETWSSRPDALVWQVTLQQDDGIDRQLRVRFCLPAVTGFSIWGARLHSPVVIDGVTPFCFYYPPTYMGDYSGVSLPMVVLYDSATQIGLTVAAPFDAEIPQLKFLCEPTAYDYMIDEHEHPDPDRLLYLEVEYSWIGLRGTKPLTLTVYLAGHEPHWRAGLAWAYRTWREYFEPTIESIHDRVGNYTIVTPAVSREDLAEAARLGAKMSEVHGHFPVYGNYAPDEPSWPNIAKREGKGGCEISPEVIDRHLAETRSLGIQPFIYFQFKECDEEFAERHFPSAFCRSEAGRKMPAWPLTCFMCADDEAWRRHIVESAKKLIARHRDIAGFFLDCWGFRKQDFAHDDGITLVNGKRCYSFNFGYTRLMKDLWPIFAEADKPTFVNGPLTVQSCRYIDSIMTEGSSEQLLAQHAYLALAKPHVLLSDSSSDVEEQLQMGLRWGCFHTVFAPGRRLDEQTRRVIMAYSRLTAHFERRRWVLHPDPLGLPEGLVGNVFVKPGPEYLTPVLPALPGRVDGRPLENVQIVLRVPEAEKLRRAIVMTVADRPDETVAVETDDGQARITIPYFDVPALVRWLA